MTGRQLKMRGASHLQHTADTLQPADKKLMLTQASSNLMGHDGKLVI